MNNAQQMYALSLDECVTLIGAIGHERTVLMQGDTFEIGRASCRERV